MPFERDLVQTLFVVSSSNDEVQVHFPCPQCGHRILKLVVGPPETKETRDSFMQHDEECFALEDVTRRFSFLFECTDCREPVAVCGVTATWTVPTYGDDGEEDGGEEQEEYFYPQFILPAPQLFAVPGNCPKEVKKELNRVFSLFWCDIHAAANAIRSTLEILLDSLKVPRKGKTKKNELRPLKLHGRIERFSAKHPVLGKQLLAVKWLGNPGSHGGKEQLTKDDLFDAFEILSHTLDEIYTAKQKKIETITKEIIRRKGPRKKPGGDVPF